MVSSEVGTRTGTPITVMTVSPLGDRAISEIVPSMEELASGRIRASRVRPVEVQDLLGRSVVEIDTAGIRQAIEGRVALVTGAGGSIGSELCRQVALMKPARLVLAEHIARIAGTPVIWISPTNDAAERLAGDLRVFLGDDGVLHCEFDIVLEKV